MSDPFEREAPAPLTIAMAGASGFVGTALRKALRGRHAIVGLTRSPNVAERGQGEPNEEWRHCDLFSLSSVTAAMEGADVAIYLVHSMLPSSRLTQGSFEDLDLILADNFARAAAHHGVRQIVYIGGLVPPGKLSTHLESRHEVERTLGSTGVPVTSLRAGLIVGPGGSSTDLLVKLVKRLPIMALPSWTRSKTQPIAIADVVRAVEVCLDHPAARGRSFDLGGAEVMTYADMIARTAAKLGQKRPTVSVPLITPRLSRLWVSLVTGASSSLTGPLVESLRHDMLAEDNELHQHLARRGLVSFDDALQRALEPDGRPKPNPRAAVRKRDDGVIRKTSVARSVQRLPLPAGRRARWVAAEYMRWLPNFVWPLLRVRIDGLKVAFRLSFLPLVLLRLRLEPDESSDGRQYFAVIGGALAKTPAERPGHLEFREVLERSAVIAAVHDFAPRLPWYVYNATQALAHLWVMNGFGRHLGRAAPEPDAPARRPRGALPAASEAQPSAPPPPPP
ncbi:MAG: NAD(P)H-binding protein [Myxococcota bacterium]